MRTFQNLRPWETKLFSESDAVISHSGGGDLSNKYISLSLPIRTYLKEFQIAFRLDNIITWRIFAMMPGPRWSSSTFKRCFYLTPLIQAKWSAYEDDRSIICIERCIVHHHRSCRLSPIVRWTKVLWSKRVCAARYDRLNRTDILSWITSRLVRFSLLCQVTILMIS